MRILSWNINGIRTLPQYHPWNSFKDCNAILEELHADIICFQEMKSSRLGLPRDVALPQNFASFFSFPVVKGGYSGVAVYTDSRKVIPLKAEEGLSGKVQPKPPLTSEERISPSYPSVDDIQAFPDEEDNVPSSFEALDAEGRALVVDFGLFVLINVYCPNETSDARLAFKMNYHLLLQERVRRLVDVEHREVIVVGDINICATPLDHCDGHLPSNANTFWEHPARAWFHKWLDPNGPMIDIVRSFWPGRKGLYTCWNTRISARETNYGTRVDYILVTRGLLKWIKHGDIQPSLKGSDHCPIYIDLHDEITLDSGETLALRDAMQQGSSKRELPRIAAKNWEEFSRKQTLLSSFFGKKGGTAALPSDPGPSLSQPSSTPERTTLRSDTFNGGSTLPDPDSGPSNSQPKAGKSTVPAGTTKKRKSSEPNSSLSSKRRKGRAGQPNISTFFSKGTTSRSPEEKDVIDIPSDPEEELTMDPPPSASQDQDQLDADYRLALQLSEEGPAPPPELSSSQSKAAWSSLFTPMPPPKCLVHDRWVLGTIRAKANVRETKSTTNIVVTISSGRAK
ncbi:unnamed protein product [Somion occarium]|uniref:DNA-(apurinic or apyrimidinic site) endonuclease n=1 Tax=Somion occarium TaxID=3059160 RepID=A0ABP1E869_9APHY